MNFNAFVLNFSTLSWKVSITTDYCAWYTVSVVDSLVCLVLNRTITCGPLLS